MRARGLTLVEVVASLVLMAGVVSSLLVAQGKLLSMLRGVEDQELAATLTRELIARWETESPIAAEGEFENHPGWRWVRSESTTLLVRDPTVKEVTLRVVHRTRDGADATLVSYHWLEKNHEPLATAR